VPVTQVPPEKKSAIKATCPSCAHVSLIHEMRQDQPYRLANPAGGTWAVTYHHCQTCGAILIYEPGDGGQLVPLENVEVELVEE